MSLTPAIDPPADLARFRLSAAVAARFQSFLDRQDAGPTPTPEERAEAEGLADLADLLTLLRLRLSGVVRDRNLSRSLRWRGGAIDPHIEAGRRKK
jgi:hypothetical protein